MIKLIAIDLDGTLLRTDKTLTQENLEAIHHAQDKGVKVVLCTGRPYLAMKQFADQIGFNDEGEYIVAYNGAQVRKANDGKLLVDEPVYKEDLLKWYKMTEKLKLPLNPIDDKIVYEPLEYPDGNESTYDTPLEKKKVNYHEFDEKKAFGKIIICTTEDRLKKEISNIPQAFFEKYHTVLSHPHQLEISKFNVSKGTALAKLGEKLEISLAEMMAIGDEHNDQTMIEMVGYGIAMGNAVDIIKEKAVYITDNNDNNGVAKAIYKFIN